MSLLTEWQYGGYGWVGVFVECCDGVVDHLFLLSIIAGVLGEMWSKSLIFIAALAGMT